MRGNVAEIAKKRLGEVIFIAIECGESALHDIDRSVNHL